MRKDCHQKKRVTRKRRLKESMNCVPKRVMGSNRHRVFFPVFLLVKSEHNFVFFSLHCASEYDLGLDIRTAAYTMSMEKVHNTYTVTDFAFT